MITTTQAPQIDYQQLKMLVMQTAATVQFICANRDPSAGVIGKDFAAADFDPVALKMRDTYSGLEEFDHSSGLESMVELVYDFVKLYLDSNGSIVNFHRHERRLVADTLEIFQDWKTRRLTASLDNFPGSPENTESLRQLLTSPNDRDWSGLNYRFR